MKQNLVDIVIGYFDPARGVRRLRARHAQQIMGEYVRKYEGASRGRRTEGWYSGNASTSANVEVMGALSRLRDRSRDLVRNNGYASKAIQAISNKTIGTGIVGQAVHENDARQKKIQAAWKRWAETTACDFDGRRNLYGIQKVAMRAVAEGGEAVILRRRLKSSDGKEIPVQLQVLEGDYIDNLRQGITPNGDGGYIMQGVEFGKDKRRKGYWLWNQHPGEFLITPNASILSSFVPAEDVLHIYREDRAGQIRGLPWSACVILKQRDFDKFEDAQLMRQEVAACFSGFIKDIEAPDSISAKENVMSKDLQPGTMEILPPGKDIVFPNMPTVTDDGFSIRSLRSIAIGYGISYESLTGDLSNVNYSSGRMGWIEMWDNIEDWRWTMFIPSFCDPVGKWFLEGAILAGLPADGVSFCWTPPSRPMIDPAKEVGAKRDEIRTGLISYSEAVKERGRNPEELFAEMKKDKDTLDKLGLVLDCDPSLISRGGNSQIVQQGEENGKEKQSEEGTNSSTSDDSNSS
jgi:lambda family phage portal protein